ncbi:D-2-hydroxyacid dehydrogenase [Halomonas sp. GXIMD04776]|uniref:D-2-hydroxyacid dehydrogenase n=1 Tax=Halomonas sp. GXIMD04776 TaxID=3415605 RepID=UPI003C810945
MIDFSNNIAILFIQKPEVLEKQRDQVKDYFDKNFKEAVIYFAGSPEDIINDIKLDIIITPTLEWLPQALAKIKDYKWIHFLSAGVEKIWEMDFKKKHVLLTKSSGVNSVPMSEYALGAMLYFAKQFGRFHEQSQNKVWQREWLEELTGRTVVILGLGHVGQAIAKKASAFDMRIVGMQRRPRRIPGIDLVVPPEKIKELLADADYLVVCLPLTNSTVGLVDKYFLDNIKPGCVLIDLSRGGIVCEQSLVNALDNKKLRGAALDVFKEQPLPMSSKLWNRSDVLLTPHVSGTTPYYLERALRIFFDNVVELKTKGKLLTEVSLDIGY